MSSFPGQDPLNPDPSAASQDPAFAAEEFQPAVSHHFPGAIEDVAHPEDSSSGDRLLFQSWYQPEIFPPTRIPNFGHLILMGILGIFGLLCAVLLTEIAIHFKLFGVTTVEQASDNIHYSLGNMALLYIIPFAVGLLIFPLMWHKSFLAGLQWNAKTARLMWPRLFGAATACLVLAFTDGILLPGPANAPIEKLFQTSTQAWMLFAFGVTIAPFFEEIVFRGFLLPALCTAWDWSAEQLEHVQPPPLAENGHPQWSIQAMVVGSILTSLPFAWMHAQQTGYSLGPLILLYCVSLVLCWVRLSTRSLAASVLVHACYNLLLFSLMLYATGGFRHLEQGKP
jgi:uncharacterized protein